MDDAEQVNLIGGDSLGPRLPCSPIYTSVMMSKEQGNTRSQHKRPSWERLRLLSDLPEPPGKTRASKFVAGFRGLALLPHSSGGEGLVKVLVSITLDLPHAVSHL